MSGSGWEWMGVDEFSITQCGFSNLDYLLFYFIYFEYRKAKMK